MSALSKEENQFCVCYVVQTELYLVSEMHFDELYIHKLHIGDMFYQTLF